MRNKRRHFRLTKEDKRDLLEMARSKNLCEDFRIIAENRYNPFLENGDINLDKFINFLNDYNEFINHKMRPFRKIIDKDMRL